MMLFLKHLKNRIGSLENNNRSLKKTNKKLMSGYFDQKNIAVKTVGKQM